LGNHVEASAELDNITRELRAHPDVLKAREEIFAAAKKWDAAVDIAGALVRLAPEGAVGWVHRSYRTHELKPPPRPATTCCRLWRGSRTTPSCAKTSPATSAG
jgi:hypothetical protein